jgi:hypothetical protein
MIQARQKLYWEENEHEKIQKTVNNTSFGGYGIQYGCPAGTGG